MGGTGPALPHGRLGSHRDTLSSSSLPPAAPGRADPTANYENEKSMSGPQMSIFLWRFESLVISGWFTQESQECGPDNENRCLAHSLAWHRGLRGQPPHLELALPCWAGTPGWDSLSPLGPGPVSISPLPAAWLQLLPPEESKNSYECLASFQERQHNTHLHVQTNIFGGFTASCITTTMILLLFPFYR